MSNHESALLGDENLPSSGAGEQGQDVEGKFRWKKQRGREEMKQFGKGG